MTEYKNNQMTQNPQASNQRNGSQNIQRQEGAETEKSIKDTSEKENEKIKMTLADEKKEEGTGKNSDETSGPVSSNKTDSSSI